MTGLLWGRFLAFCVGACMEVIVTYWQASNAFLGRPSSSIFSNPTPWPQKSAAKARRSIAGTRYLWT